MFHRLAQVADREPAFQLIAKDRVRRRAVLRLMKGGGGPFKNADPQVRRAVPVRIAIRRQNTYGHLLLVKALDERLDFGRPDLRLPSDQPRDPHPRHDAQGFVCAGILGNVHGLDFRVGIRIRDELPAFPLFLQYAAFGPRQPLHTGIVQHLPEGDRRPFFPPRHSRIVWKHPADRGHSEGVAQRDVSVARFGHVHRQKIRGFLQHLVRAVRVAPAQQIQLLELRHRQGQFTQRKPDLFQSVGLRRVVAVERDLVAGQDHIAREVQKISVRRLPAGEQHLRDQHDLASPENVDFPILRAVQNPPHRALCAPFRQFAQPLDRRGAILLLCPRPRRRPKQQYGNECDEPFHGCAPGSSCGGCKSPAGIFRTKAVV